jgi:hypothetical protein
MNPMDNLNDIVVPNAVNAWPLAWGWWVTISLVLLLMIVLWIWALKRMRFNAAKKRAIHLLEYKYKTNSLTLSEANQILKRLSISYCSRNQVAALHGDKWVAFLKNHIRSSKRSASWIEDLDFFSNHQYQTQSNMGVEDVYAVTMKWIKAANFKLMQRQMPEKQDV